MPVTIWPVAGIGRKSREEELVLLKSGFPYQNTEVLDINFFLKIISYYNLNLQTKGQFSMAVWRWKTAGISYLQIKCDWGN